MGHCAGFTLCLALRSAISHCSRVYSAASLQTASATLKLLCITQRKPVAPPVAGSCCARDLQIGQTRGISHSQALFKYGSSPERRRFSRSLWVHLNHDNLIAQRTSEFRVVEVTMQRPLLIVLTAVVLLAVSTLAIMNNACGSSQHEWCAPMTTIRHHIKTGPG